MISLSIQQTLLQLGDAQRNGIEHGQHGHESTERVDLRQRGKFGEIVEINENETYVESIFIRFGFEIEQRELEERKECARGAHDAVQTIEVTSWESAKNKQTVWNRRWNRIVPPT